MAFGVSVQLIEVQFNGAARAADGGEHRLEALETFVEIHGDAFVYAEGAHAADRVADQLKHLVRREHLRLEVEILLELVVVYPRVAGCEDTAYSPRRF